MAGTGKYRYLLLGSTYWEVLVHTGGHRLNGNTHRVPGGKCPLGNEDMSEEIAIASLPQALTRGELTAWPDGMGMGVHAPVVRAESM